MLTRYLEFPSRELVLLVNVATALASRDASVRLKRKSYCNCTWNLFMNNVSDLEAGKPEEPAPGLTVSIFGIMTIAHGAREFLTGWTKLRGGGDLFDGIGRFKVRLAVAFDTNTRWI